MTDQEFIKLGDADVTDRLDAVAAYGEAYQEAWRCRDQLRKEADVQASLEMRVRDLEAQLDQAREAALEEAAQVAETPSTDHESECPARPQPWSGAPCECDVGRHVAESIRALKSKDAPRTWTLEEIEAAWARMLETPAMVKPSPRWLGLFRTALTGGEE